MKQSIDNKLQDCSLNDYIGGNQTKNFYISMFREAEREFVVTHNVNIKPVSYFTGREAELKELRQRIEEGRKSVLVSGMGGIGKTHICRKLFEEYSNCHAEGGDRPFRHIGYIEYNEDMSGSLQRCLKYREQDSPEKNQEAAWRELEYLASDGKLLLFVDNVNVSVSEDPGLKRLTSIPGAVILASRRVSFGKEFEPCRIGFLSTEKCREIYEKIRFENSGRKVKDEEIQDLEYVIKKLAARHTITIEFLANLAWTKDWSVKKLRTELEQKGFQLEYKNDEDELVNIQKSYEALYDLSGLTDAEQNILEAFSIFPHLPLSVEKCNRWLLSDAGVGKDEDILKGLYRKGWLQFDIDQESYTLHPVFAQFIYEKCKPDHTKHSGLIRACQDDLQIVESGSEKVCQEYLPFVRNIMCKMKINIVFLERVAHLLFVIKKYEEAQKILTSVLEITEKQFGETHFNTIVCYRNLGKICEARGLYEEAVYWIEKNLKLNRKLGRSDLEIALNYRDLASVFWGKGEYEKAEKLNKKALEIQVKELGEDNSETAATYNNLALVYYEQAKYEEAEKLFKKVLEIKSGILDKESLKMDSSYSNLAELYALQGKYKQATKMLEQIVSIREKYPEENRESLATAYNNLAGKYEKVGEYEKAESLYKRALDMRKEILGENHPETAGSYGNLGVSYLKRGEYAKAEEFLKQSLKIKKEILGEKSPEVVNTYINLGGLYFEIGIYQKSADLLKKALNLSKEIYGVDHPEVANCYNGLAAVYCSRGDYKRAKDLLKKALGMNRQIYGENHPKVTNIYVNLGNIYLKCVMYEAAQDSFRKGLHIYEETASKSLEVSECYRGLAKVHVNWKHYDVAEDLIEKAIEMQKEILGEKNLYIASSYNDLGDLYLDQKNYKKAKPLLVESLEIRKKMLGENHLDTASSYSTLAYIYVRLRDYKKAIFMYKRGLEITERLLGTEHPDTANIYNNLGEAYYTQGKFEVALRYCLKAYKSTLNKLGMDHPKTKIYFNNLKTTYDSLYKNKKFYQWLSKNMKGTK